jgi:hypothetical protein
MSPLRHNMDFSGSQPPDCSASAAHLEVPQSIVDEASPSVDGRIILTQRRGLYPFPPPAVNPNAVWSRYTDHGTARTTLEQIYSQGPSHFTGRLDYEKDVRGISRTDATPSSPSHDSRGPMLASKGLLRREVTGSNTGVSNMLLQSDRVEINLDSTFRRASSQRADVPPPSPPNHGCTPQEFLAKETTMLASFPRL